MVAVFSAQNSRLCSGSRAASQSVNMSLGSHSCDGQTRKETPMAIQRSVFWFLLIGLFSSLQVSGAGASCMDACIKSSAQSAYQVAQNQSLQGVVSRDNNRVVFRKGYRFKAARSGQKQSIVIMSDNPRLPGWQVSCICLGGACFVSQSGDSAIVCTSHPGQCTSGCGMALRRAPPPAPDPATRNPLQTLTQ